MYGGNLFSEFVVEAIVEERKRDIENRLQRQAVLDYLRETGADRANPGTLRRSAHWLGVRLEQLGMALQESSAPEPTVTEVVVPVRGVRLR